MKHLEAALQVLESAGCMMSERQIVDKIRELKLVDIGGNTPHETICARLSEYVSQTKKPLVRKLTPRMWGHVNYLDRDLEAPAPALEHDCKELTREATKRHLQGSLISISKTIDRYAQRNFATLAPKQQQGLVELNKLFLFSVAQDKSAHVELRLNEIADSVRGDGSLTLQESHHERRTIVLLGMTGVGKTTMINNLMYLMSPRIERDDPSGGYPWNDPLRSEARGRDLRLAKDAVMAQLHELGAPLSAQDALLQQACGGCAFNAPERCLFEEDEATVLESAFRVDEIMARRASGLFEPEDKEELNKGSFLLPTAIKTNQSTTSIIHSTIYSALPYAIMVYKRKAELRTEDKLRSQATAANFTAALDLCRRRRFELVIGQGKNLILDRMHVARQLRAFQEDAVKSLAIGQIWIGYPALGLRHGDCLVDPPGSADATELCKANLRKALAVSSHIVCLMEKNIDTDSVMQKRLLMSGIYERALQDPLNHSILIVQVQEKSEPQTTLAHLQSFHNTNQTAVSCRNGEQYLKSQFEAAAARLRGTAEIFPDYVQYRQLWFFPYLFTALCLRYRVLERSGDELAQAQLLERITQSGGLHVIGALQKLFYGQQQRALDYVLHESDKLLAILPHDLARQCAGELRELARLHAKLCEVTLEHGAMVHIGVTLLQASDSIIFPQLVGMRDTDCVQQCQFRDGQAVGGDMIYCDHCQHCYHVECIGVTVKQFARYKLAPSKRQPNKRFYCNETYECQAVAELYRSLDARQALLHTSKRSAPQRNNAKRKKL